MLTWEGVLDSHEEAFCESDDQGKKRVIVLSPGSHCAWNPQLFLCITPDCKLRFFLKLFWTGLLFWKRKNPDLDMLSIKRDVPSKLNEYQQQRYSQDSILQSPCYPSSLATTAS